MPHIRRFSSRSSSGVTLIELMVVVTITALVIISMTSLLAKTVSDAQRTGAQAVFDSRLGFALNRIERDIRLASAFNGSVETPYSDPYDPSVGWDYAGTSGDDRVLILTLPATVFRDKATSRILTYQDSVAFNCTSQLSYNPVHSYKALFFVEDGTLYKRFLTDTTTALCNTQIQKQSCPKAVMATWPSQCRAPDEIIAQNVARFSVEYALSGEANTISDSYSNPDLIEDARAAVVTLQLESGSGSTAARASATMRMARTN